MKTAVGYIRVSTDKQEEYSPESQRSLLKEYAASHDMIITDFYEEIGISGKSADKRPEFNRMIYDAGKGRFDVILVWKFSRFARNQSEASYYKAMLRKKLNIDVISVSEPIADDMSGRLVEMIIEWNDENYLINLSQEVKRGMTQKALNGGYNSRPPIGYKKDRGPHTVPYIDEAYADMVRAVFHMYADEHLPANQIAFKINHMGYRTRSGHKWESRNIWDMISNPFYIGKIRWNNVEGNRSRKLSGATIVVDGQHEALISKELFDRANAYRTSTKRTYKKRSALGPKHWLAGLLVCSECGATMSYAHSASGQHAKYPFFRCHRYGKGLCSAKAGNSINQKNAETAVMDVLEKSLYDDNLNIQYREGKLLSFELESLKKQLKSYDTRLKRIKEAYVAGIDTLEEYKAYKDEIEKDRAATEARIKDLEPADPEPTNIIEFKKQIRTIYDFLQVETDPEKKSEALHSIIDHIVYDKASDSMDIYFYM